MQLAEDPVDDLRSLAQKYGVEEFFADRDIDEDTAEAFEDPQGRYFILHSDFGGDDRFGSMYCVLSVHMQGLSVILSERDYDYFVGNPYLSPAGQYAALLFDGTKENVRHYPQQKDAPIFFRFLDGEIFYAAPFRGQREWRHFDVLETHSEQHFVIRFFRYKTNDSGEDIKSYLTEPLDLKMQDLDWRPIEDWSGNCL